MLEFLISLFQCHQKINLQIFGQWWKFSSLASWEHGSESILLQLTCTYILMESQSLWFLSPFGGTESWINMLLIFPLVDILFSVFSSLLDQVIRTHLFIIILKFSCYYSSANLFIHLFIIILKLSCYYSSANLSPVVLVLMHVRPFLQMVQHWSPIVNFKVLLPLHIQYKILWSSFFWKKWKNVWKKIVEKMCF